MSDQLTIKDIAKYCGVGVSTVSRAINDDPGISPKTKERVLKVVKKFHYIPNNSARNLKIQESNTIALIVRGLNNIFFQSMFDGFQTLLYKNGYDFLIHLVDENTAVSRSAIELAKEKRLKGVIFLGGQMEDPAVELDQLDVPYVLCTVAHSMYTPMPNVNLVAIDDAAESCKAVKYLIEKGHRRIAIITGHKDDRAVGGQRLSGYKRALAEAGIAYDEDLVGYMEEDIPEFTTENGYAVAKKLLSRTDFTALFCISDITAIGAYKAISEAGLTVADDLSVVGFDGIDLGRFTIPSLTTISQPKDKMVKSSVDLLMKAINGDDTPRQLVYSASLLERESVKAIER